ncbi:MAG: homocysteine S-methyltransferase family protein [Desulfovibrio sp.]|jgi:5-methyltetrahydrofolate--homocysteine methyltransferase|nr:homocysteine S-methyltransferase family protein [Desulfovibrio sp.]
MSSYSSGILMSSFASLLAAGRRFLFDGAMGTMLQRRGLGPGESPEAFCLAHPDVLEGIHADYAAAGADILTTNTFGGTRYKLPKGIAVFDFNRRMARVARKVAENAGRAAGRPIFVAGSIGPSGLFLHPLGDISFEDMVKAYTEQIRGLMEGGADFLLAETQFDIAEARAIVHAVRRECSLPVAVSMTYEGNATLTGSSVAVCSATLANMGVDLLGVNCSAGPVEMRPVAEELLATSPLPVLIQPNAGLPELEGDETRFPLEPEDFARLTAAFARAGSQAVGGCCGTTPEHIASLARQVAGLPLPERRPDFGGIAVSSRSSLVRIGKGQPFCLVGERINPTGKKTLSLELQAGEMTSAMTLAHEQIAAGASILDVNVGAPLVDETTLLPELVARLVAGPGHPLCLDSSNVEAIASALTVYPASCLVNSISGEAGRMEILGPLCRDFGVPFILLPLCGRELPVTAGERIRIVEDLLVRMEDLHIPRRLALVDVLALAAASSEGAGKDCLEFIRYCAQTLHLPTVCGLSNISFGLPARELINAAFLGLAAGAGLTACIANPGSLRIAEILDVTRMLMGQDQGAERFIVRYAGRREDPTSGRSSAGGGPETDLSTFPSSGGSPASMEEAVISGRRDHIEALVRTALDAGEDPFSLVGERLIPAITEVGAKYERKEYFLPQLIRSAETMQAAFALLRPLLEKDRRAEKRRTIVMATVEGDIHDIGKNIVCLMLGNHGFQVVDLGKDITAADIVAAAEEHDAAIIGLSALMTTTMVRMRDSVELIRRKGLNKKVMVGGAVVSEAFARSIGAYYAKDAVDAVRVALELSREEEPG